MKIKNILRELQYYLLIRQTGKTTLLKNGIDNYPRYHWVVVPTLEYADSIVDKNNKLQRPVAIDNITKIRGTHQAMIIDQEANLLIFSRALDEIDRLESETSYYLKTSHEIVDLTQLYQSDLHKMQIHIMTGLQIPWWNIFQKWKHRKETILLVDYIMGQRHRYDEHFKKIKSNLIIDK